MSNRINSYIITLQAHTNTHVHTPTHRERQRERGIIVHFEVFVRTEFPTETPAWFIRHFIRNTNFLFFFFIHFSRTMSHFCRAADIPHCVVGGNRAPPSFIALHSSLRDLGFHKSWPWTLNKRVWLWEDSKWHGQETIVHKSGLPVSGYTIFPLSSWAHTHNDAIRRPHSPSVELRSFKSTVYTRVVTRIQRPRNFRNISKKTYTVTILEKRIILTRIYIYSVV